MQTAFFFFSVSLQCKLKDCKQKIEKDELRIGKKFPNSFFTEEGESTEWYHPKCIFQKLKKAKATTKKIESEEDLQGFGDLADDEQKKIK